MIIEPVENSVADLSIVIVSWNTCDLLRACLTSLRSALVRSSFVVRIVVVDNGSSDSSVAMVSHEFPEVLVVDLGENTGFAAGVNAGVRAVASKFILLLNSDTVLTDDSIDHCMRYLMRHEDVAVVGCHLTYPDGRDQSSTFRFPSLWGIVTTSLSLAQTFRKNRFLNWDRYGYARWQEPTVVDCVMGSFMLIRRSVISSDDLLDSGYFMYAEETDLCWQLNQAGHKVIYLPDVTVVHQISGSTRRNPRAAAWAYGAKRRGILRFLRVRRGLLQAYIANALYLLDLIPRALYWGAMDILQSLLSGSPSAGRFQKAQVAAFHIQAVLQPSRLLSPWHGPTLEK